MVWAQWDWSTRVRWWRKGARIWCDWSCTCCFKWEGGGWRDRTRGLWTQQKKIIQLSIQPWTQELSDKISTPKIWILEAVCQFYVILLEGGRRVIPGGGGSRWIFDVMLGSRTNLWPNVQTFLLEKCTHFTEMYRKFRPKMHPSLWNVQKIWPKIVPICMPYAGQILFKDIPLFLKSTEC